uniref:Uncharacterized protein n=1 Tax=Avena sativa TaxID=4498 RepID=A0ACD5U165_AVESA
MHLLKNIHRRKPVHSHSLQNQVNGAPLTDSERREFEEEIGRLKREKSVLLADLQRQAQQQGEIAWLMQSLEDRIAVMDRRQHNIVASVRDILHSRGGDVSGSALVETDHFSKKRRVPKIDFFAEEPAAAEEQQAAHPHIATEGMFLVRTVNAEPFEKMELAMASLEKLFQRAGDYASSEEMYSSVASPALDLSDLQTAAMETSVDAQPTDGQEPSSPAQLPESPGYVQSPMLLFGDIHQDTTHRATTAEADMSSEVSTTDTETGVSHEPVAANDQFWERFLSDTPQFSLICSESHDDAGCKRETTESMEGVRIGIDRSWLNHRGNVDQITEQMELLASNEKT